MDNCERLRRYNRWRRGDKRLKQPDPKAIGELIDSVADRLDVLEREHAEFFDRLPRDIATLATDAPGTSHAAITSAFSSSLYRRRPAPLSLAIVST